MRKTKDISKYNLDWQVTRVQCKDLKTVESKVEHVLLFLSTYRSNQNRERVVNYLEGLALGYKNTNKEAVDYINDAIASIGSRTDYAWDIWDHSHVKWSDDDLLKCYKDNFKRFKLYANRGYIHNELYEFLKTFSCANIEEIEELKISAKKIPNSHHFFF